MDYDDIKLKVHFYKASSGAEPVRIGSLDRRKRNQKLIVSGRVEVLHGSVSSMPFSDATFDCVTAVEVYYFWPDIAADLAEVRRVIKPNGQLVILAGMYLGSKFYKRNMKLIRVGDMRCFSVQEFEDTLQDAGSWRIVQLS